MRRGGVRWAGVLMLAAGAAQGAVPITSAPLSTLLTQPVRSAPAQVQSLNDSQISAQIQARIDAIPVRVGDPVSKGDLLVELDCRQYRSRLAAQQATEHQTEARRQLAVSQLARARSLRKERNIGAEQLEQRQTDVATLSADGAARKETVRQAELEVDHCEIRAPFDAVVAERQGQVGALAMPGTPLIRVVQTSDLEVSAQLTPTEAREVQGAERLELVFDGQRRRLRLRRLVPVIDPRSQTQDARLELTDGQAPAGAVGRLEWLAPGAFVPADLLVRRQGVLGVFSVEEGRARFHALPDALEGQPARVELPPGTPIVVEGRQRLSDGEAASATNAPDS
jgi:RND family efflux transporter MFP subunit